MWRIVAAQELRMLWRSRRFKLLMLLSVLLFSLALLTGWQHGRDYQTAYTSVMGRQDEMFERQGELNPHSATHHGVYAFKPWSPLSAWDPGLLPYLGSAVMLESHKQNFDRYRAAQDQLRLSRFSPVTLATLFQYLVPLLVILLAYAMIAEERENGTLKLLLVQGSSPLQLFYGKAAALAAALALLLVPVLAVSLGLMGASGPIPWARLLPFVAAYGLYWAIFIWLALLVSARSGSSRTALLVLLGVWFINALIVPRVGLGWMQAMNPLPTAGEFQREIVKEQDALPDWDARTEKVKAALFKQYGVKDIKAVPVNLDGAVLQDNEADDTRIYAEHFARLYARYRGDENAYSRLGWLFPTVAIQSFSQSLAGSDYAHHAHFLAAAEKYRFDYVSFLNNSITKTQGQDAFKYTAGNELWKQVPDFHYDEPAAAEVLSNSLMSLAALGLWLLLLIGVTPVVLKRMQVVS